ncbi:hypothetical protein M1202_35085, partial [Streptomyces ardesiacus]
MPIPPCTGPNPRRSASTTWASSTGRSPAASPRRPVRRARTGRAHGPSGAAPGIDPVTTAQISFNYLGQFDGTFAGGFADSLGMAGYDTAPVNRRPYLIDVVGHVRDGRLRMQWTYSPSAHREETVREVAERTLGVLSALTEEARRPQVQGYTPSDWELSGLDQRQIDDLVAALRGHPAWRDATTVRPLEDCLPQTPVQQG